MRVTASAQRRTPEKGDSQRIAMTAHFQVLRLRYSILYFLYFFSFVDADITVVPPIS